MATKLAEKEGADVFIVQLASLLHDVDDIKLSPQTYKNKANAISFMKSQNLSNEICEQVCQIIEQVSFSNGIIPTSLEAKCVQDTDRLDAIGAIGIARTFAYGGSHGRAIYDPEIKPNLNMNK